MTDNNNIITTTNNKNNNGENSTSNTSIDSNIESKSFLQRRFTLLNEEEEEEEDKEVVTPVDQRFSEALKQLFCGGVAGSIAKTITAPFSRLAILFQVHSLVTTKENRPKFATTISGGARKIIERGGILSLWKGNLTSVIHRFPYSAINFYCYENSLDLLVKATAARTHRQYHQDCNTSTCNNISLSTSTANKSSTFVNNQASPILRFVAGSISGTAACMACYPLDLVRTRLTTELPGHEHYKGIVDAFAKIVQTEGLLGLYAGMGATLLVAVPNFAISYTAYGTLKEHVLDDDLFYNMRKIDYKSGEERLGFIATLLCGAASGMTSTFVTYPCDTVRRRMQIQSLHIPPHKRMNLKQNFQAIIQREGYRGLYRGLTPELLKVIPMVGVMFTCYEFLKEKLDVS